MSSSSDSEEEMFLLKNSLLKYELLKNVRFRSVDAHPINKKRLEFGEFHHLYKDLCSDEIKFFEYMRMSISTFDYIHGIVKHELGKNWCNLHKRHIKSEERLMLTVRYLSTGMSFRGLASSFRMGAATVSSIVSETVDVLWRNLHNSHMPAPTEDDFRRIAREYYELWNFPHCVGAIDGKHVRVKCPAHSGSMFFNYKSFYSIVLQAVVDANYKFVTIDVGGYGKQSDGGTFRNSDIYRMIQSKELTLPVDDALPNSNIIAPYVFIGDDAYPLCPYLLKPFKGDSLSADCEYFNMRLSRARRTVQCAFGIIFSKWRILGKAIECEESKADRIVKTICLLHNVIIDKEGMNHNLNDLTLLPKMNQLGNQGGRPTNIAVHIRDIFKIHVCKNPIIGGSNVTPNN